MNYDIYTHSNLASYTERALILIVTVNLRVFSQLLLYDNDAILPNKVMRTRKI